MSQVSVYICIWVPLRPRVSLTTLTLQCHLLSFIYQLLLRPGDNAAMQGVGRQEGKEAGGEGGWGGGRV